MKIRILTFGSRRRIIAPLSGAGFHLPHEQFHAITIIKSHTEKIIVFFFIIKRTARVQSGRQIVIFFLDLFRPCHQSSVQGITCCRMRVHNHFDIQRPFLVHFPENPEFKSSLSDFHPCIIEDHKTVLLVRSPNASERLVDSHPVLSLSILS